MIKNVNRQLVEGLDSQTFTLPITDPTAHWVGCYVYRCPFYALHLGIKSFELLGGDWKQHGDGELHEAGCQEITGEAKSLQACHQEFHL
jgi:hypothetical protein